MLSLLSDSVCLRWGPRVCISNKFLGDADAVFLGHTLRTTGVREQGEERR